MANLNVWWTDKIVTDYTVTALEEFFSAQTKRLVTGYCRYQRITLSQKKYLTRLCTELSAYRKTGNREHLFNIANYAFLESQHPENKKFHWNSEVASATRKES